MAREFQVHHINTLFKTWPKHPKISFCKVLSNYEPINSATKLKIKLEVIRWISKAHCNLLARKFTDYTLAICQIVSLWKLQLIIEKFFQNSKGENIDQTLWRKLPILLFLTPYWVNTPSYARKWKTFGNSMNFLTTVSLLHMSMYKNQGIKYRQYKT